MGSLCLSVCMVMTMLPVMAFAKTKELDSSAALEIGSEITSFAVLDEDIATQVVKVGTKEDELNLSDKLTATTSKKVPVTTNTAITVTVSGEDSRAGRQAQELEVQEEVQVETKESQEQITVPVSSWIADQRYDGKTTGDYIFTPMLDLPEGLTVAIPITATKEQNGVASVSILDQAITDVIAKAQDDAKKQGKTTKDITVALNVTMPDGADSLTITLTRDSLSNFVNAGISMFEINGSPVKLAFDQKALEEILKQSDEDISIAIAPSTNLSASAKAIIGTRPAYDLTISYIKDGKYNTVSNFGDGKVSVSIPYTPARQEVADGLYGVYVDEKGNATPILGSVYDAKSGCVIFATTHFSIFGIGYTALRSDFIDIINHWAKESIDYVVNRGLLNGTTEKTFEPNTVMTRGMLVTALGRLANVNTKEYTTSSIKDVKANSTFSPYIEWAYEKGSVRDTGNGKFEPDRAITREEIAVIFANFASATGYTLPVIHAKTTYTDDASIGNSYKFAVTAMHQAGIMMGGSGNKFNPKLSATRGELSTMIHRYIILTTVSDIT